MIICSIDSEICCRNCQIRLFHAIVNWLCVEIRLAALTARKKFQTNIREFLCCFAFFIVYFVICMIIKVTEVRFLKRRIKALYQLINDAFLNISFFNTNNSIECQMSVDFRKHCEITILSLISFLKVVMFFNRFVNAYTSR